MPTGRQQAPTTPIMRCAKRYISDGGDEQYSGRAHRGELLIRSQGSTV